MSGCECMQSGFCDFQMMGTKEATRECPCFTCIVKSMCVVINCEIRDDHHLKIFGFRHIDEEV